MMRALQSSVFPSLLFFCIKVLSLAICCMMVGTRSAASISHGNITDRLALLAFKAQITDDPLRITTSWNDSLHFCHWHGVSCGHRHKRVTELNLRSLSLKGSMSISVGNLSFLRRLDLSNNSFHGDLPNEISHLFRLQELALLNNSFGGQVPAGLTNCSELRILRLAGNEFTGKIPLEIGFLSKLELLNLATNNLEGAIPPHMGNFSSLVTFKLAENKLQGEIPASVGQLKSLNILTFGQNMLSGPIPQSMFNFSNLGIFHVGENQLQGSFPQNIGLTLPNIEVFCVSENQLSGTIPISFSNASNLVKFEIYGNSFFGRIPDIFGSLKKLGRVAIGRSNLGYGKVNDLDFFTAFTNCSDLQQLYIQENNLGGALPNSIGNLSAKLAFLSLYDNGILGNIPPSIGNLVNLSFLSIGSNRLNGTIPETIGKLHNLAVLGLDGNELSGEIPASFGNLTLLNSLWLGENNLQGNIPPSLRNCQKLQLLHLHDNSLNGTIPPDVIGLSSLSLSVLLSENHLTGSLPLEMGNLKNLLELYVSHNQLSGNIPVSLGKCTSLIRLSMDHNMFEGTIESLRSLRAIEEIDLSHNNFSGSIPKDFVRFDFLSKLNLSFNDLEGEVPRGGIFNNASANISLVGNAKLCSGLANLHLGPCSNKLPRKQKLTFTGKLIISIVCGLLGACLMSYILIICCFRKKREQPSKSLWRDVPFLNISYGELLKATNGFCPENLIGIGGFGSVFKGILEPQQLPIAVKVLDLERRGASKSFMAECETLRNIRHRNLVKIITACSSVNFQGNDFKALVYELMPNGSLEDWLYPNPQTTGENQRKSLTLAQRLNVVIDVASALDYLHYENGLPIIHGDLKPANILLDQDMLAHVSDFGLSRIIADDDIPISENQSSSVGIKGTIGYAAPEYGMGSKMSTQGDVYSFGILLLEIFTGKKPTDENLEGFNLHQFVKMALPIRMMEIIDQSLMIEAGEEASCRDTRAQTRSGRVHECLLSIFMIGLKCSEKLPIKRMKINDALKDLHKVKKMLLRDEQQ